MQDVGQPMRVQRPKQDMDMIGHDDPVAECVALAVEEGERVADVLAYGGVAQDAGAVSGIEPVFDPLREALVVLGGGGGVPGFRVAGKPSLLFLLPVTELVGRE
jgi:hypothetical protein